MTLLDSAAILDDFERSAVTVETPGEVTIDALREVVHGPPSVANRNPVVHPADRRMLERLPEADRSRETIALYDTIEYAQTATVTYQGRRYEVASVADYDTHGGVWLILAQLLDEHAPEPDEDGGDP